MTEPPDLAEVLAAHRRCFYPHGGPAFCACNKWSSPGRMDGIEYPDLTDGLAHHEHQAQAWQDACTITTVEQLDALPVDSIVLPLWYDRAVCRKYSDGWYYPMSADPVYPLGSGANGNACLLLWHPEWAR